MELTSVANTFTGVTGQCVGYITPPGNDSNGLWLARKGIPSVSGVLYHTSPTVISSYVFDSTDG